MAAFCIMTMSSNLLFLVLAVSLSLGQGAAVSPAHAPAFVARPDRQAEQSEHNGERVDHLSELKAGLHVLQEKLFMLPLQETTRDLEELKRFEKSLYDVCVFIEFATSLDHQSNLTTTVVHSIISAIQSNACNWINEAFGMQQGDGGNCSLEVICAKKQLNLLAVQARTSLGEYRRSVNGINVTDWEEKYLDSEE